MAAPWSPATDVACSALDAIPDLDDICFPGGFCLSHVWDKIDQIPHAADMSLQFYSQIGPAMSFLQPFFNTLDTVLALFRCVQAVPDAITNLDPTELFECVPELVEKINQLLSMIPQLSLPKMIIAIVRNLAYLLRGVAADLDYIQQQVNRIIAEFNAASDTGDLTWAGFLSCAEQTMTDQSLSTAEALKGLGRIVLLVNLLIGLFGGPEVPCFSELLTDVSVLEPVIAALLALADLLDLLADSIPDPQLAITIALGDLEC